jgi:CRISPR-associated endonuclease/helicase Cas3
MKSFNCSKDVLDSLLPIFEELSKTYYAHLSKDKSDKETLFEHSDMVSKYCLRLMEAHEIDQLLDSLIEKLLSLLPIKSEKDFGNLFKEIFIAAIAYHDLGKVNPNFQVQKMENELFSLNNKLSIQSNHSLLGAYLFQISFLRRLLKTLSLKMTKSLFCIFLFICLQGLSLSITIQQLIFR